MNKHYPPARTSLTDVELSALIRVAETPLERAIILTLIDTAMRRSELMSIRVERIDWTAGSIVTKGKGGGFRLVSVGKDTMLSLVAIRNGATTGPLWRLSKSGLKRILDRLGERAGVDGVFPHRFRVTRICDLIEKDMDPISVGAIAGHSLEMVRYYTRSIEQQRAVAAARRLSLVDQLAGRRAG